ncbi:unnamed protein product [Brassica oleracea]
MKNLLIKCLTAYLKSSNLHVESVSIRNATTDVSLQNLKVDIFCLSLGQGELHTAGIGCC